MSEEQTDTTMMGIVTDRFPCGGAKRVAYIHCSCHMRKLIDGGAEPLLLFKRYDNDAQAIADGWQKIQGKWFCKDCATAMRGNKK